MKTSQIIIYSKGDRRIFGSGESLYISQFPENFTEASIFFYTSAAGSGGGILPLAKYSASATGFLRVKFVYFDIIVRWSLKRSTNPIIVWSWHRNEINASGLQSTRLLLIRLTFNKNFSIVCDSVCD